jgi:hypothetical protein
MAQKKCKRMGGMEGDRERECSERENEGEMKSSRIEIIKVGEQKR